MKIAVYAGSLRPGGGLSVLRQVLRALIEQSKAKVVVIVGNSDTRDQVRGFVHEYPEVEIVEFLLDRSSGLRYLASKIYFLFNHTKVDWVISFNYYLPASSRVLVYHINLLSYIKTKESSFFDAIKRLDARIACWRAEINLFESEYLRCFANRVVKQDISSAPIQYVGVNPVFYSDAPVSMDGHHPASRRILMVSSIQPHKNNEVGLRAFARLCRSRPQYDWALEVCGGQSVSQWEPLMRVAKTLGVAHLVKIVGPVPPEALAQRMARSFCLLNPSTIESFCMVALEAMAAGCPVLVTDKSAMPESVGAAGIVVSGEGEEGFVTALLELADDEGKRQKAIQSGRNRAGDFTIDNFAKKFAGILQLTERVVH